MVYCRMCTLNYYEQWADTADSKIFESAHHCRIELNRNGRFEFESNLEASQVPIMNISFQRPQNFVQLKMRK